MTSNVLDRAYEVLNPSFNDMTLEQQIDAGCNDWCAEHGSNRYYGETKAKAESLRARFVKLQ
jgi:hypothetical protein